MTDRRAAIVGAGRMGQGIGLALARAGWEVCLLPRTPRPLPPPLAAVTAADLAQRAPLVLVATPDAAIADVARMLAAAGGIGPRHVVLHCSGLLDRRALGALAETGAGLGSFHPLQTVADPETASDRLGGAYAGIEGDPGALAAARALATALGMTAVPIDAESKPLYHAGAVFAANYATALAWIAERTAIQAGIPEAFSRRMYLPLAAGTAANLVALGPVRALTGPVRRGDVATIRAHLAALPPDLRPVYRMLGLAALELAREAGLADGPAEEVAEELRTEG